MKTTAEIIAAIQQDTAAGEDIVAAALADVQSRRRNYERAVFPTKHEPPPDADISRLPLPALIDFIVTSVKTGRSPAAALGLAKLRDWYDAGAVGSKDESTWQAYATKYVPLPFDIVVELLGSMMYRNGVMHCTKCGAEARCPCGCNVPYVGVDRWVEPEKPVTALERAKAAIAAHPEQSNRALAKEIGVTERTVRRARDAAPDAAPAPRVGRDGKSYPSKQTDPDDDSDSPQSQYNAYFLRADAARSFATYRLGPIDQDVIDIARDTAATWAALVEDLKAQQLGRSKGAKANSSRTR